MANGANNSGMKRETVKVFVSSTFNDMHAERDYLLTEVLPYMEEWCEKRKLRFEFIDLRWGVTEEETKIGKTVSVCMKCIDACRPFFLCFLGQRRGWVPTLNEIKSTTVIDYPMLSGMVGKSSITEMEIEHATTFPLTYLLRSGNEVQCDEDACFFIRKNPFSNHALSRQLSDIYLNSAAEDPKREDEKLNEIKEMVLQKYHAVEYSCIWNPAASSVELETYGVHGRLTDFRVNRQPLKELLITTLCRMIERRYPDRLPYDAENPWDKDIEAQNSLAFLNSEDIVGRKSEEKTLDAYLCRDHCRPMMIYAEEGYGKRSLLSRWYTKLVERGDRVIFRSCCMTEKSYTLEDLARSIAYESTGTLPAPYIKPFVFSPGYFETLSRAGVKTLIIDGAQRINGFFDTRWDRNRNMIRNAFCEELPEGFHVVFSVDTKTSASESLKSITDRLSLDVLSTELQMSMIQRYMDDSLKQLSQEQIKELLRSEANKNPLFLSTVLHELNRYGDFHSLDNRIMELGNLSDNLFHAVLGWIEQEYIAEKELFIGICLFLSLSRGGLTRTELENSLRLRGIDAEWERIGLILQRLKPYLFRAQTQYGIRFGSFSNAVMKRYEERSAEYHKVLATMYFDQLKHACNERKIKDETSPVHGSGEVLYHYEMAEDWEDLKRCFTDPDVFAMIDPATIGITYYGGTFYGQANAMGTYKLKKDDLPVRDTDEAFLHGAGLMPKQIERRKVMREFAVIFLEKAIENKNRAWSFPQPHRQTCIELRNQYQEGKNDSFLIFRDSFYQSASWMELALAYEECGLNKEAYRKELYAEFKNKANPMLSFMDYLENFGVEQTDLSGALEDLATGSRLIAERIEKYLDYLY